MKNWLILIICSTLSLGCYYSGLSGIFLFDDTSNLLNNTAIQLNNLSPQALYQAAFSTHSGHLQRPISVLSFAFNYYFSGGFTYADFALTNILIHGLSAFMLFLACQQLLNLSQPNNSHNRYWALAIALLWLVNPIQLTSVLYIVQRMSSLAGLFVWASIWAYLKARQQQTQGGAGYGWLILSLAVLFPLALLSKENAVLLPLLLVLIECFLLKFKCHRSEHQQQLKYLFWLILGLPSAVVLVYLALHPELLVKDYRYRDFNLYERLLTQANALWLYLRMMVLPEPSLFALFHDEAPARNLSSPPYTWLAVFAWPCLVLALIGLSRKWPWLTFGLAFFLAAHLLESSVYPLELIHEHRNYLPSSGLIIGLVMQLRRIRALDRVLPYLLAIFGLYCLSQTWLRANLWGQPLQRAQLEVYYHPDSARSQITLAQMLFTTAKSLDAKLQPALFSEAQIHAQRAFELKSNQLDAGILLLLLQATQKPAELPSIWPALLQRLAITPLWEPQISSLQALHLCQRQEQCPITKVWMQQLLETALANPSLAPRPDLQANVHTELAVLFNSASETPQQLSHAKSARILAPENLQIRLNYLLILKQQAKQQELSLEIQQALADFTQPDQQSRITVYQE